MLQDRIMTEALAIAAKVGIEATTRDAIAARVPCSAGSVSFHYGEQRKLKRAIVERAVATENLAVIGWAVAERHPSVQGMDSAVSARALRVHLGK